jgi:hypothetical protein
MTKDPNESLATPLNPAQTTNITQNPTTDAHKDSNLPIQNTQSSIINRPMGSMGSMGMGGMGSMGMGGMGSMGMGGMGMGGMGMGGMGSMGGMGGDPNRPRGFRDDFGGMMSGMQSGMQILYAGVSMFSFGGLFVKMSYKYLVMILGGAKG